MKKPKRDNGGGESPLAGRQIVLWIVCLAALSVGARNFELGMGSDGPLYSTIARGIARSGEWFRLDSGVPDFVPFCAHPHLGFWWTALVFKVLPAADWSARIPGHLFYVSLLVLLFCFIRRLASERAAALTVLILWAWSRFSNPFSNGFLDPGAIFFGMASLFLLDVALVRRDAWRAAAAGASLAACVATKGFFVLGFAPTLALIALYRLDRAHWKRQLAVLLVGIAAAVLGVAIYAAAVHRSNAPEFFSVYWSIQVTDRVGKTWTNLTGVLNPSFWGWLLKDTYYLAPLALLPLFEKRRKEISVLIPLCLLVTFILMFATNGRGGGQYFPPLALGMAWLIAIGTERYFRWRVRMVARVSASVAIALVVILQYLPIGTHGAGPSPDETVFARLSREKGIRKAWLDGTPHGTNFINGSRFAWWGDVTVGYVREPEPVPEATADAGYVLFWPETWEARSRAVASKGWCVFRKYPTRSVWLKCPVSPTDG